MGGAWSQADEKQRARLYSVEKCGRIRRRHGDSQGAVTHTLLFSLTQTRFECSGIHTWEGADAPAPRIGAEFKNNRLGRIQIFQPSPYSPRFPLVSGSGSESMTIELLSGFLCESNTRNIGTSLPGNTISKHRNHRQKICTLCSPS